MKLKLIAHWILTVYLSFALFGGAVGEFTQCCGTLETHTILGYPIYFMYIIATWKVLGTIAILAPRFPRVKEWAYAGIFFNMTGAAVSHAATGNVGIYGWHVIYTLSLALTDVASWALRPQSRTLGVLFTARIHS